MNKDICPFRPLTRGSFLTRSKIARMKVKFIVFAAIILLFVPVSPAKAQQLPQSEQTLRLVSWNTSGNTFVTNKDSFRAIMLHTRPDILVLDEVLPSATAEQLREVLDGIDPQDDRLWNIDIGISGGRQRSVIASRWPIEKSFSFSRVIPYPEEPRKIIAEQMTEQDHLWIRYAMEGGIPANAAIVVIAGLRLLVVAVDLQCCGGETDDWQEYRRSIEAKEIRRLTILELSMRKVDGTILAGDLNAVATLDPVELLLGLRKAPQHRLLKAEILHLDGLSDWTWDGRGTQFTSSILDYQLYYPDGLRVENAYVFDTEDLDAETRASLGLQIETSNQISRHRPLVVDYSWRDTDSG